MQSLFISFLNPKLEDLVLKYLGPSIECKTVNDTDYYEVSSDVYDKLESYIKSKGYSEDDYYTTNNVPGINKSKLSLREIKDEAELKQEINTYKANISKIDQLQASIQSVLDTITSQQKEETKRFKAIQKFMESFKLSKVNAGKWVASLERVDKYKVLRPDYKELWETALTKLNIQTVKVLKELENLQLDAKSKEQVNNLDIHESKFTDMLSKGYDYVVDKLRGLLTSMTKYTDVVASLPNLHTESVKRINEDSTVSSNNRFKDMPKVDQVKIIKYLNKIRDNCLYGSKLIQINIGNETYADYQFNGYLDRTDLTYLNNTDGFIGLKFINNGILRLFFKYYLIL